MLSYGEKTLGSGFPSGSAEDEMGLFTCGTEGDGTLVGNSLDVTS